MTRQTPLADRHRALGARLVEFAGWQMPLRYRGILEEHRAVRERAGLFDLSHMGEIWIEGRAAAQALAYALVTDPAALAEGRAHYSMICRPDGGIIDDLIVYRLPDEAAGRRYLVVANASNTETVAAELAERLAGYEARLVDRSLATALVALQGPRAATILAPLSDVALADLRYYAIARGRVAGIEALVARTGYTGEDGFELFVANDEAGGLWDALLAAGAPSGLVPCGLGARDTLRLEAGMPLYGNELDLGTNPFEAGLGRVVRLTKADDFVGRAALAAVADRGPGKRLVGMVVRGRGIARHGYPIYWDGAGQWDAPWGQVTSGTVSPTLGVPIAMGYVPPPAAEPGTMLQVGIRGANVAAEVVSLPFYRRAA